MTIKRAYELSNMKNLKSNLKSVIEITGLIVILGTVKSIEYTMKGIIKIENAVNNLK